MSTGMRSLFPCCTFLLLLLNFTSSFLCSVDAQSFDNTTASLSTEWNSATTTMFVYSSVNPDYSTAALSTEWSNSGSAFHFDDGSAVKRVLGRYPGPSYACGFYCNGACDNYLFAVFFVHVDSSSGIPQVVWSANRNSPVKINATLELMSSGDLVLKDADGSVAWSTNTSGKAVVGLNLTEEGNLVLFDEKNGVVWQSFDYPTDSLVLGQKLSIGKKLTPSVSDTNWTASGLLSLAFTATGLLGLMETDPPQIYYQGDYPFLANPGTAYVEYVNGSLKLFANSTTVMAGFDIPYAMSAQYMRLGADGHLRVYGLRTDSYMWEQVGDPLNEDLANCTFPTYCGEYGICSSGLCSCPASEDGIAYFRQINYRQPGLGCAEVTPLSCSDSQYQTLIQLWDVSYFYFNPDLKDTTAERCKQACKNNCKCKAAIFRYMSDSSSGSCYLPSKVFTLINNEKKSSYNSISYIKVQNMSGGPIPSPSSVILRPSSTTRNKNTLSVIIGSTIGALLALILLIGFIIWKRRRVTVEEEVYLDQVPGMPTRFSYEELKAVTVNFSKKLGAGGFGSVFEGILLDGTKIAVKQMEGLGQIKKSFLAEIETIGGIHHVNLVRLVGFCADKSNRLLVYEFMANGSLDRWIYHKNSEIMLEWQQRKKIILDVAKGLNYLHEDCRHKIIHLDIKPQNILLDENFNAKVSDFGLSKLIDRDQSQVVTTMRGTPGYLAPEWLSAAITEKADVYSFGIVILEIVCGRKVFDNSLNEDDMHLLSLFKRKAEEQRLLDIVDKNSEDTQLHGAEAVNVMMVAGWCLQGDTAKRPSMSAVVKALEWVMEVEVELEYNFLNPPWMNAIAGVGIRENKLCSTTPLLPSVLSGPR